MLALATGGATKSGCENCPCIYNTTVCCSMETTVRVMCLILLILSVFEMGLDTWVFIIAPWNVEEMQGLGLSNGRIARFRILKAASAAALVFGSFRLGAIYYMYGTLKDNATVSKVITARGLCICTSMFSTILQSVLTFFAWNDVKFTKENSEDAGKFFDTGVVSKLLLLVLSVDIVFLVSYALCAVETYRSSVLERNSSGIRMGDWANRENDKYKAVTQIDGETTQQQANVVN